MDVGENGQYTVRYQKSEKHRDIEKVVIN